MQFKNIAAFVSLAVMASALPTENLVARTPTNTCTSTQTLACCTTVTNTLIGLQLIPLGQGCTALVGDQCAQNSQVACCNTGSQTGLINVGSVCPIVAV